MQAASSGDGSPAGAASQADLNGSRIASIRHWLVHVPFTSKIEWGSGTRAGSTRLVVEVTTRSGHVGYGETIALLHFVEPVLVNVVIPLAQGKSVFDVERLSRHVEGAGYYHHKRAMVMALCAVEMAMWDARGKICGQPLCNLLGGRYRDPIRVSGYVFGSTEEVVSARARAFLDAGYTDFKLKIGMGETSDEKLVAAVRAVIGPEANLRVDVNGAWTTGTARRRLATLAKYNLQYVEQPLMLDDVIGHRELRLAQPVPVAIDEGAYTLADVGNIVRTGAADVVLLDPHELGGLWQCVKAAGMCEALGIPVTLHSGGELGISQAAYLHLAASIPNMSISIDTEHFYHADDIVTEPHHVTGGTMKVPAGPGLGVTPALDALERYRSAEVLGAYLDPERPDWFPMKPAY